MLDKGVVGTLWVDAESVLDGDDKVVEVVHVLSVIPVYQVNFILPCVECCRILSAQVLPPSLRSLRESRRGRFSHGLSGLSRFAFMNLPMK